MNRWSLEFAIDAEKDLGRLSKNTRERIIEKLDWLINNFENIVPLPLTGEFKDFYKLRVGKWRVIYKAHWLDYKIVIHYIGMRDKIYKQR